MRVDLTASAESEAAVAELTQALSAEGATAGSTEALRGFAGIEWETALALPVTTVALQQTAAIIVAWLEARASRQISVGEIDFRGYSVQQVKQILADLAESIQSRRMVSTHSAAYRRMLRRLKAARKEAGVSQEVAGEAIGVSQSSYSKIERGERRIDPVELDRLAKLFKKDTKDFVG